MVTLVSSDGELYKVSVYWAKQSPIIAQRLQHHDGDDTPTVSIDVPSEILAEIIDYWEMHVQEEPESVREENDRWDAEFVKMDIPVLCGVIEVMILPPSFPKSCLIWGCSCGSILLLDLPFLSFQIDIPSFLFVSAVLVWF